MNKKIIGWAVQHWCKNTMDANYIRTKESEADDLLNTLKSEDMFPEAGKWKKVPVYEP